MKNPPHRGRVLLGSLILGVAFSFLPREATARQGEPSPRTFAWAEHLAFDDVHAERLGLLMACAGLSEDQAISVVRRLTELADDVDAARAGHAPGATELLPADASTLEHTRHATQIVRKQAALSLDVLRARRSFLLRIIEILSPEQRPRWSAWSGLLGIEVAGLHSADWAMPGLAVIDIEDAAGRTFVRSTDAVARPIEVAMEASRARRQRLIDQLSWSDGGLEAALREGLADALARGDSFGDAQVAAMRSIPATSPWSQRIRDLQSATWSTIDAVAAASPNEFRRTEFLLRCMAQATPNFVGGSNWGMDAIRWLEHESADAGPEAVARVRQQLRDMLVAMRRAVDELRRNPVPDVPPGRMIPQSFQDAMDAARRLGGTVRSLRIREARAIRGRMTTRVSRPQASAGLPEAHGRPNPAAVREVTRNVVAEQLDQSMATVERLLASPDREGTGPRDQAILEAARAVLMFEDAVDDMPTGARSAWGAYPLGFVALRVASAGPEPRTTLDAVSHFERRRAATEGRPASPELMLEYVAALEHAMPPEQFADLERILDRSRVPWLAAEHEALAARNVELASRLETDRLLPASILVDLAKLRRLGWAADGWLETHAHGSLVVLPSAPRDVAAAFAETLRGVRSASLMLDAMEHFDLARSAGARGVE